MVLSTFVVLNAIDPLECRDLNFLMSVEDLDSSGRETHRSPAAGMHQTLGRVRMTASET